MSGKPVNISPKPDSNRTSPVTTPNGALTARRGFHVLAKPTGPICNLDCEYCFFLSKESLYPGDRFRMPYDLLEIYIRQLMEAHAGLPEVTVAWQGGEPTLMGVDFFERAVALVEQYRGARQHVQHTIQTNGTLLTDEWCQMFLKHKFLVGISIDGPPILHDTFRKDKRGNPSSDRVLRGLELLKAHKVEFNILCTVNAANQSRPIEVYRYFRDELGAQFIQFIPIVERVNDTGYQEGNEVTSRSVDPLAFGRFLIEIFDEWIRHDVGKVFVNHFDTSLASWVRAPASLCIFAETCGRSVALEHNGDLYSCDHFVEPKHLLGNIRESHMLELIESSQQVNFANAKRDTLPVMCQECSFKFACNGECPKNRFVLTPTGEEGLNYLCPGYLEYFNHIDGSMKLMAQLLEEGRFADEVMTIFKQTGRNEPCPCGSKLKAKNCHQR